jgi:DNA-damage-inducible protein D
MFHFGNGVTGRAHRSPAEGESGPIWFLPGRASHLFFLSILRSPKNSFEVVHCIWRLICCIIFSSIFARKIMADNKNLENASERLVVFQDRKIRRVFHEGEWYFSIIDIIEVLTESPNPRRYWSNLKIQLSENEGFIQLYPKMVQLKLMASDGKMRETDTANTETLFRIIQSIPSPKAEPFKRWLAQVGYERIKEIEDPELATQRTRALYKAKGYPDDWIEKRMRGIAIREKLTDEWDKRGIKQQREYAILTAEISKATFGLTPSEYKEHKGLEQQNLRDHMTDLELIFTMLGEASTTEIAVQKNAQGFPKNMKAAQEGGGIAGNARRELEQKSGHKVVSQSNYLDVNSLKIDLMHEK